jgi:hypothetical protein
MRHADGKSIILCVLVGLWIAAGGFLFGDAQPSAQAGLLCGRYCVSAGQCPPERGGCLCTLGLPLRLCYGTSISWGICVTMDMCSGHDENFNYCSCYSGVADLSCGF